MMAQTLRRYAGIPLVVAVLAAACDSSSPDMTQPEPENQAPKAGLAMASIMEGPYSAQAVVTCTVVISTRKFRCVSPQDPDPLVPAPVGGRGVFVRLVAIGVTHVPDSTRLRADVRLINQLMQKIGTVDGSTPTGLKAFFVGQPTVTGGTGTVTVTNADGNAEFTAPGQNYFEYNQVRRSGQATVYKNWQFNVPATVTKFTFKVHASANIMPMVVFDMSQGGNRDLYRANIDGTDLVQLTTHAASDVMPTVAADRVIFTSYRDGNAELYSMPLLGGTQTRLTNTPWNETEPYLSRDNLHLAWVSTETGERRIFYGPSSLASRTQIPNFNTPSAIQASPAWETNGTRLIYSSTDQGVMNIYRLTLSTGGRTLLMATSSQPRFEPQVSQDGKKVVFAWPLVASPSNSEIYSYEIVGKILTRVSTRSLPDAQPTFLHDGRVGWLMYTSASDWVMRSSTIDELLVNNASLPAKPSNLFGVPLL